MERNRTTEILSRFAASWRETKARYDELIDNYSGWTKLIPLQQFISSIIAEGNDQYFRAGTSVADLFISRSVDHGLRIDQKYIKIEAVAEHDFEVSLCEGEKVYRTYRLTDLGDARLLNLLKTLKSTLVD